MAQPIRAQQSTLIMSDHAQLSTGKTKTTATTNYNDKNNKNNNQKHKVIITLSYKLMASNNANNADHASCKETSSWRSRKPGQLWFSGRVGMGTS